ncbi:MAG: protein translocase subunit SecF, partial [Bacteroidaceae bacterium]|nr:protein translocase subunit SecF [Bacteroidaceae bacterium]
AIVLAVGFIICWAVRGLSTSIDFTGGRNYIVAFDKAVEPEDVREALQNTFPGSSTSALAIGTDGKTVRISTNYKIESNDPTIDDQCETKLYESLKKANLVTQADIATFKNPDLREGGSIISSTKVGPSIAKDITHKAIISVIVALIAIFLYIMFRFKNFAFSVGAVVALALDTLLVIGMYAALWGIVPFSLEIDQVFIGAILTVVGYSINDKVVVFDRIRENLKLYPRRKLRDNFNNSINETLTRTINTSFSTLLVLLCIFILGGDSIRSFSFAMILGVVFGTLSSIFIAAPIAYVTLGHKIKDEAEEA